MDQILRGARANTDLINGVKYFKCDACEANASDPSKQAVNAPPPYSFNHEVLVDVFFLQDMAGDTFGFLSMVDNGTTFHICINRHGRPRTAIFAALP